MHVLITGAAGMLGRKLTGAIVREGGLNGHTVSKLTLVDVVRGEVPADFKGTADIRTGDISDASLSRLLIAGRPDVIFHLAAVVSAEAEIEFEKGYTINVDGLRNLLQAIRREGERAPYKPRVVFTSSIAVFGTPFPEKINDEFILTPRTSYGAQKAIGEFLLADYARKGFLEGIGLRLPTVCIRPGKPNKAASGFFSSILREPLVGQSAVLPVDEKVRHWHVSPRRAVGFLLHASTLDLNPVGHRCILNMPGLSATVEEQIEALRRIAGDKAVALIQRRDDSMIASIIAGWPRDFDTRRALDLGFIADVSFDEIIRIHIEDELQGHLPDFRSLLGARGERH